MTSMERIIYGVRQSKLAIVCLSVFFVLMLMAIFPGLFTAYDASHVEVTKRLLPPSGKHFLWTDGIGRDVFACLISGARATFGVLFLSAVISVPIGLFLGVLAGYAGSGVRRFVLRLTDVFLSFPRLVLAMMLPALLGCRGWLTTVSAMALTLWPYYTRLACVETMRVRHMPFVHIAVLQGARFGYLMRVHFLPFIIPSAVIRLSTDCSLIVLTAASLGFLGLGIAPDVPEWGALAAQGSSFLLTHSWIALAPGMVIFLLSFSFQVLGDVVRDALDPKQK